jgi:hypothetical protein
VDSSEGLLNVQEEGDGAHRLGGCEVEGGAQVEEAAVAEVASGGELARQVGDVIDRVQEGDPFVALVQGSEQRLHDRHYVAGLLSGLEYKNAESIAYLHDPRREPLQQFLGQSP